MNAEAAAHQIIDQANTIVHHATLILGASSDTGKSNPVVMNSELLSQCVLHLRARRQREKIFGTQGLFADPAWDILLELFMMHLRGKQTTVTGAGLGANVPQTTVLRWLNVLISEGLVERVQDTEDRRRALVNITDMGATKVRASLREFGAAVA